MDFARHDEDQRAEGEVEFKFLLTMAMVYKLIATKPVN